MNTVFIHKLKQEGIEIALLVSHWLIFLTNQQTKVLAPNYNPSGFTQVRIGNLINQSATSCAISIPPLLEDCSEQKTFKDVARRRKRILMLTLKQADVRLEYKARVRFALPYSWPNINWIVA